MVVLEFLKKHATLPAVLLSSCLSAEVPLGIVGGINITASYTFLIGQTGEQTLIDFGAPGGSIRSVAINTSGSAALLGGSGGPGTRAILYILSYNGGGPLTIPVTPAIATLGALINSVAINTSTYGIIGGQSAPSVPYAATVSSFGIATPVTLSITVGAIQGVAVNDSGLGLIGGIDNNGGGNAAYAALVSPSGIASANLLSDSAITRAVDISASGRGIIGGENVFNVGPAFAALVSSFGNNVIPLGSVTPLAVNIALGSIRSVAINASNQGIIGGTSTDAPGYAAFVSPAGVVTPITTGALLPNGVINDVAINNWGQAIIGGRDGNTNLAFAALVSPSGGVTLISTGITSGFINSVDINQFGQGLIGGLKGSMTYTAIVSPSGVATPVTQTVTGQIVSVSMTQLPAQIPTAQLSGNSLKFADYINEQAPQDVFYFIPAMFAGTLEEALKSAAPTRNAISLYTANNNLFYLNNRLSGHLRHAGRFRVRTFPSESATLAANPAELGPDELTASISEGKISSPARTRLSHAEQNHPCTLWVDGIGAWSRQKAQKQTVGFDPITGAAILGFDGVINSNSWMGLGAAYSYTHVHEKHSAGHSNINQEYLFLYGSHEGSRFYVDGALWAGWFQIHQVRNIRMTGFEFKSNSHPTGWQLSPHLEFGNAYKDHIITLDPFVMIDWVNSWQSHYKETGDGPLNTGQKKHYSSLLRAEIGARFYQTISCNTWRLSFQEKGSYVYKRSFQVGEMHAFLVGSPGTFTVETLTTPKNLGVVEAGIIAEPTNPRYPYGSITYQMEFSSSFKSQQVSLELAWSF